MGRGVFHPPSTGNLMPTACLYAADVDGPCVTMARLVQPVTPVTVSLHWWFRIVSNCCFSAGESEFIRPKKRSSNSHQMAEMSAIGIDWQLTTAKD